MKLHAKQNHPDDLTLMNASIAQELRIPLISLRLCVEGLTEVMPQLMSGYLLAQQQGLVKQSLTSQYIELLSSLPKQLMTEVNTLSAVTDMLLIKTDPDFTQQQMKISAMRECIQIALAQYNIQEREKTCK